MNLRRITAVGLVVWSIATVLSVVKGLAMQHLRGVDGSVLNQLAMHAPWWLGWALLTPLVVIVGERWRLDDPASLLRRAPLHLLAAFVIAGVHLVGAAWVSLALMRDEAPQRYMVGNWYELYAILNMVTYFVILGAYYSADFAQRLRAAVAASAALTVQSARLREQQTAAQLHALRVELNPHFLFNALNATSGLVRGGRNADAVTMLARIGDLLRVTLAPTGDGQPEVPLQRELDVLNMYLDVERVRFGPRLDVIIDVPPRLTDACVPPLILQPLAENALRHGVERRPGRGSVRVRASDAHGVLYLEVRDSSEEGMPRAASRPGSGIGLANVRERLHTLYGSTVSGCDLEVTETGAVARVHLPLRIAT